MLESRLIVGGERYQQRAFAAQIERRVGSGFQVAREHRPRRLAGAAERHQRLFAGFGLGADRQHAGGRVTSARTGHPLVEHGDSGAALRQPPRDRKADHAGADDGGRRAGVDATFADFHRRLPTLA